MRACQHSGQSETKFREDPNLDSTEDPGIFYESGHWHLSILAFMGCKDSTDTHRAVRRQLKARLVISSARLVRKQVVFELKLVVIRFICKGSF